MNWDYAIQMILYVEIGLLDCPDENWGFRRVGVLNLSLSALRMMNAGWGLRAIWNLTSVLGREFDMRDLR